MIGKMCVSGNNFLSFAILIIVFIAVGHYSATAGEEHEGHSPPFTNIFLDPHFWRHFEKEVGAKAWSCNFENDVLQSSLEKDASLYDDDSVFRRRRGGVKEWTMNTTLWITTVLGACKELSRGQSGTYTQQLQQLNILEAFVDYFDHLNFFQQVADKMTTLGEQVKPFSQDSSGIHDIDKLDPVMLVGYSERFEDNMTTSVWNLCVDRHTKVNPHHEAHCMWHGCCQDENPTCSFCKNIKKMALREMVCDKVSRRVQKNLGGKLTRDMWDIDIVYFSGLPENWLDEAINMMQYLKGNDTNLPFT